MQEVDALVPAAQGQPPAPAPAPALTPIPSAGITPASLPLADGTAQSPTSAPSSRPPGANMAATSAAPASARSGGAGGGIAPASMPRSPVATRDLGDIDVEPQLTVYDEGPSPHMFGGEGSRPVIAPIGAVRCGAGVAEAGSEQVPGCVAAEDAAGQPGNVTVAASEDGQEGGGAGNGHLVAALLATVAVAVLCSIGGAAWFVHSRRGGAETAPSIAVRDVRPHLHTHDGHSMHVYGHSMHVHCCQVCCGV